MTSTKKSSCRISLFSSLLLALLVSACGGGGGGDGPNPPSLPANVANVYVSSGGTLNAPPNSPFVTITLCQPDESTNCILIDNILVDTGSVGLRVFAQPINAPAISNLNLIQQTVTGNAGDDPIAECMSFVQGVTWGPVQYATLQIGGNNNAGEIATNFPIQVIGDSGFNSIPTSCSNDSQGFPFDIYNDPVSFGANGVLGIGPFQNDCGVFCTGPNPVNMYYECDTNGNNCAVIARSQDLQVPNPTAQFPVDNNGVILTLPNISPAGAEFVVGSLTFGIDTQDNNTSLNANTILIDNNPNSTTYSFFSTILDDGSFYPFSFFDSGSNGFFFNPLINLTECFSYPGFYCPGTTLTYNAEISGIAGSTPPVVVDFDVADASDLFNGSNTAFNDLAGPTDSGTFDWGLPFFYGTSVYVAIDGATTNQAAGPYFGF